MTDDGTEVSKAGQTIIKNTLVVALDVDTRDEALELIDALDGRVRYFKVGHRLFTRYGPQILDDCAERDVNVVLDLKLYDIPSEVEKTCRQIATHDAVYMTTVHASGGREMMQAALEGSQARGEAGRPRIMAVTALTSFSGSMLPEIGVGIGVDQWDLKLAELAIESGVHGVVTSTRNLPQIRQQYGDKPMVVTPGIRLPNVEIAGDDQKRIDTPADALSAGATMLMMGRPVVLAPNPLDVVDLITESIVTPTPSGELS